MTSTNHQRYFVLQMLASSYCLCLVLLLIIIGLLYFFTKVHVITFSSKVIKYLRKHPLNCQIWGFHIKSLPKNIEAMMRKCTQS